MLFNSVRISFTYLHYYLDPAGFIEKLCVNKDRPELKCNGKCYLMKVLKQKDQDQNKPNEEIAFKEITLFIEKIPSNAFITLEQFEKTSLPTYSNLYSFLERCGVDHPPKQAM